MALIKPTFQTGLQTSLTSVFEKLFLAKVKNVDMGKDEDDQDINQTVKDEAKKDANLWGKEISKVIVNEVDKYIKMGTVQVTVLPGQPVTAPLGVGFTVGPGSGLGTIS